MTKRIESNANFLSHSFKYPIPLQTKQALLSSLPIRNILNKRSSNAFRTALSNRWLLLVPVIKICLLYCQTLYIFVEVRWPHGQWVSSLDQAVRVQAQAWDIGLCSWVKYFTLTVSLTTQKNKWVPPNFVQGINL